MPVAQSNKLGTSVDIGDLLTQRKRNTLNQVITSQRTAGTYKPHLSERSFEMINLQRQTGVDSDLLPKLTFKEIPRKFFRRG
jgi:hypothetical protein